MNAFKDEELVTFYNALLKRQTSFAIKKQKNGQTCKHYGENKELSAE